MNISQLVLIGCLLMVSATTTLHAYDETTTSLNEPQETTLKPTQTTTTQSNTNPTTTLVTDHDEPLTSIASDTLAGSLDSSTLSPTILNDPDVSSGDTTNDDNDDNDDNDATASGPHERIEAKSISHSQPIENMPPQASAKPSDKLVASSLANADDANVESAPSSREEIEPESRPAQLHSTGPQHLNMTQIDQIYVQGRKDEQETVESWHRMQKKLKRGISSVIGAAVPFALNMSQEAKISSNCSGAMLKWVLSMNQLKAWALRMLDASGKPIAGLLEGSMTMFGNYRQCLKVRAPDDDEIEFAGEFREYFRGKYCVIQAKPWLPEKDRFYNLNTKLNSLTSDEDNQWYERTIFDELSEWLLAFNFVNIRYDLCVPSLCSREDIQKAINYLLRGIDLKARVLRCETDKMDNNLFSAAAQVETGEPEVAEALVATSSSAINEDGTQKTMIGHYPLESFSQLGWILIPLIATVLVLVASALSLTINTSNTDNGSGKKSGKFKYTIKSLSLKRSVSSHLNVDYDQLADDKPLSLYGVRFLLVLWVILVESAVNLKFEYLRELMMLKDLIFWWPMQFIINSTMQYDSLILLTAFTMGYKNCLNDSANQARALTKFVVDKYVRLMPSIMVMVALVILMPLVYRGPVWNDYVTKQSAVCQSTGWVNSIFLQNYLPYGEICLPQTWLLCVEFQLVLVMAPIVYYLNKSYASNFGANNKSILIGTNNILKRQELLKEASRRDDSSKMFHWIWTVPGTILVACIALGLGSSFYNVYYKDLPPSWFYTMADPDSKALYFSEHMTKIWTHLAVFAMGILAGVECRRATKNVYRSYKSANIVGFMSAHTNSLTKHHKSQSSSATSLPIFLGGSGSQTGSGGCETISSKLSASDWNTTSSGGGAGSSISININSNQHHHNNGGGSSGGSSNNQDATSSTGGSEIGCINHASDCNHATGGAAGASRGYCSMLLELVGFLMAITIMAAIIFSTHDWSLNNLPKPFIAGIFDAGSRFLWSLAMIWILYMISVPYANRSFSLLARALGHPGMVCLGKLSFLIYIIHPFVHMAVLAIQEQPIYSSWLMMFHILIGNITITVILASLVSLFVEMPCRNLFRRCGTSLLLTQTSACHHHIS